MSETLLFVPNKYAGELSTSFFSIAIMSSLVRRKVCFRAEPCNCKRAIENEAICFPVALFSFLT